MDPHQLKPQESLPRLEPPLGSPHLHITLSGADVTGEHPPLNASQQALLASLVGQETTASRLFEVAALLEAGFAQAGYPLVRVVLPAQELKDNGSVQYHVINGFIETVDASSLPEHVRDAVLKRTAMLIGRKSLTQSELEFRVGLAADVPGLRLRSTLARGTAPGGVRLILEGTHDAVSIEWAADNGVDRSLGDWQGSLLLSGNSIHGGVGQAFAMLKSSLFTGGAEGRGRGLSLFGAGLAWPLNSQGTLTGTLDATTSATKPVTAPGTPTTRSRFTRFAARMNWLVSGSRSSRFSSNMTLERIEQHSTAIDFGLELKRDEYTATRLAFDYMRALGFLSQLSMSGGLSQGLGGRDESSSSSLGTPPLSRQGSGPRFTRVNSSVRWVTPIGSTGSMVGVHASAQTSFGQPMMQSEQFLLDGPTAASGFTPGSLAVDSGATLRIEVTHPKQLLFAGKQTTLAPYVFSATGSGRLADPTSLESSRMSARSLGGGARIGWAQTGANPISIDFEWARISGVSGRDGHKQRAWLALRGMF